MLDYYEEALKELEEVKINLDNLSNNEIHDVLQTIINRGWLQIETMFGGREQKKYTKEEIQHHFNEILKVVPITRIIKKK